MAEFLHPSTCYAHVLAGNDIVDLGAEFLRVWVNGPGGTVSTAPGEAASLAGGESRLYGDITVDANVWTQVTPHFPSRYLQFTTGGTWTIHRCESVGRRTGRN